MSGTRTRERIGWFSKIPAVGDFVGRGLPTSLVRGWDEWLSVELAEARERLAEHWSQTYRRAPTLCFLLGTRVLDERAWHGILLPSRDRVGREFPLTIAQPVADAAALCAHRWWVSLASLGTHIRESARSADAVDEALAAFAGEGCPDGESDESDVNTVSEVSVGAGRSAWWRCGDHESPSAPPAIVEGLPRGGLLHTLMGLSPD